MHGNLVARSQRTPITQYDIAVAPCEPDLTFSVKTRDVDGICSSFIIHAEVHARLRVAACVWVCVYVCAVRVMNSCRVASSVQI